ncbi:hypothetical protein Hanom_Chr08g00705581 [Helianthus anomalus]
MRRGENVSYTMNVQSIEGVEVDFEDLWGVAHNDTPIEANPNPEPIPEEVQRVLWLRVPPLDLTQKKRFGRIRGEYSGQIRSWDFDE